MDDSLMPIGMFSRASSLSIKALRAYHEGGILVPARVDSRTGYRAYTVDQLADAAIVLRLRALDVPLDQVRQILQARDPELTRRILADHQVAMQSRLAETERIVAELQSGLAPVTHTPVHVRDEAAMHTVRILGQVTPATFETWLDDTFARLEDAIASAGLVASGCCAALYSPEIADDDGIEQCEAFIPIAEPRPIASPAPGVSIGEIPAARVAVLVHVGDYDGATDTYRTLGAWVARHAESAGDRIREWYVVNSSDTDDPAAYRTEIAWPITSAPLRGATP